MDGRGTRTACMSSKTLARFEELAYKIEHMQDPETSKQIPALLSASRVREMYSVIEQLQDKIDEHVDVDKKKKRRFRLRLRRAPKETRLEMAEVIATIDHAVQISHIAIDVYRRYERLEIAMMSLPTSTTQLMGGSRIPSLDPVDTDSSLDSTGRKSYAMASPGKLDTKFECWLEGKNFVGRHYKYSLTRLSNTCEWVFDRKEYREWSSTARAPKGLLCYGKAGTGKSVLMSSVIDSLRERKHQHAFFYMGYGKVQSAVDVAVSLLDQLCRHGLADTQTEKAILKMDSDPVALTLDKLQVHLSRILSQARTGPPIKILFDALERENMEDPDEFAGLLKTLLSSPCKVFATSRGWDQKLFPLHTWSILMITEKNNSKDIRDFVEARVNSNVSAVRTLEIEPGLRVEVLDGVVRQAQGIFFFGEIEMTVVLAQITVKDIRAKLASEAVEAGTVVSAALSSTEEQPEKLRAFARSCLTWLTLSQHPMRLNGLCEALAVEHELDWKARGAPNRLSQQMIPTPESVLACCKGLVTRDPALLTAGFTHHEIQKHIPLCWSSVIEEERTKLASACVKYLLLEDFSDGPCETLDALRSRLGLHPFLRYAANCWGEHVRNTQDASIIELSRLLLNQPRKLQSALQIFEHSTVSPCRSDADVGTLAKDIQSTTALQIAARFGIDRLVFGLLNDGHEVLRKGYMDRTPLDEALNHAHKRVLEHLLQFAFKRSTEATSQLGRVDHAFLQGFPRKAETVDAYLRHVGYPTLLRSVDQKDMLSLVSRMCRKADHHVSDEEKNQALHRAVSQAYTDAVRILLRSGVNPDGTSLVEGLPGHTTPPGENPVRSDLESNTSDFRFSSLSRFDSSSDSSVASSEAKDHYSHFGPSQSGHDVVPAKFRELTPLMFAIEKGNIDMVQLLLDHNASPQLSPDLPESPLMLAVRTSAFEIAQALLMAGADPSASKGPRSALNEAIRCKSLEHIRLLLHWKVRLDSPDVLNPLLQAVRTGDSDIVALLLDHGANIEAMDEKQQQPLHLAAAGGNEAIVRLLLQTSPPALLQARDFEGQTPLDHAEVFDRENPAADKSHRMQRLFKTNRRSRSLQLDLMDRSTEKLKQSSRHSGPF